MFRLLPPVLVFVLASGCLSDCRALPMRSEWHQEGVYEQAKAAGLQPTQPRPGLPFDNATIAREWDNASLVSVGWTIDRALSTGWPPIQLKPGGEIGITVWEDLTQEQVRAMVDSFLSNVTAATPEERAQVVEDLWNGLRDTGRWGHRDGTRVDLKTANTTWNGSVRAQELFEQTETRTPPGEPWTYESSRWRFEFDVPKVVVERRANETRYSIVVDPRDRVQFELYDASLERKPDEARARVREIVTGHGLPPPPRAEVHFPNCAS